MSNNIFNRNTKCEYHGYNEWYYSGGKLFYKGFYNNGVQIDYEEFYYYSGELEKRFHI